jgi:hypothetical protein
MYRQLKMTAEKQRGLDENLRILEKRVADDDIKWKRKVQKLADEQKAHMAEKVQLESKIHRLETQLREHHEETEKARAEFNNSMAEEDAREKATFEKTKQELEQQLAAQEKSLHENSTEHWEKESALHRKIIISYQTAANYIEAYDNAMHQQQVAINKLRIMYEAEKKELASLTVYFKLFQNENERIKEEMELIRQRRRDALQAERKRNHAALLVQQLFKGYGVREEKRKKAERKAAKEAEKGTKKGK